ncbi:hypothetical protein Cni_G28888 [Canna indica]|uniref:PORR domain-containing protein n=1 Tax=Canna indica TaxID=4628 RepID=A0AAQ3QSQ5_9LILI|nr:hypothetical protein Cni_G28888 [Canna indica]
MTALVDEEEVAKDASEPARARRLAKILVLSRYPRLNVVKINELKRGFGFPDDYLLYLIPKHLDTFRIVNNTGRQNSKQIKLLVWDPGLDVLAHEAAAIERGTQLHFFRIVNCIGRRNSMEIELLDWDIGLVVSALKAVAMEQGTRSCFFRIGNLTRRQNSMEIELLYWDPGLAISALNVATMEREKFDEFNDALPYVSPYSENQTESEKRAVGIIHEILSIRCFS